MQKKRYWLKGIVTITIVWVAVSIAWFLYFLVEVKPTMLEEFGYVLAAYGFYFLYPIGLFMDVFEMINEAYVYIPINVFIIFVLGAVLGWIYGKIKNRNFTAY